MIILTDLAIGFVINFTIALIIVRFIYYPQKQNKNYVFTFLAFNTIIFFLLSVLGKSTLSLGVGFGLFALFSMLSYRTAPLPSREMTYLFTLIALPAINSILLGPESMVLMLFVNGVVVVILLFLERGLGFHYEFSRKIVYDNIELLRPGYETLLLSDLQQRTGMAVKRVEVGDINLVSGTASLRIYFDDPQAEKKPQQNLPPAHVRGVAMENVSSSND